MFHRIQINESSLLLHQFLHGSALLCGDGYEVDARGKLYTVYGLLSTVYSRSVHFLSEEVEDFYVFNFVF